jgi:2-polyprenyl-3-methyl-5-hydroxy-6-metoxy-1,4-benzoquinol methylase
LPDSRLSGTIRAASHGPKDSENRDNQGLPPQVEELEVIRRTCGDENVSAGRASTQLAWYEFALRFARGRSVLDVGCGLGDGLQVLKAGCAVVKGQDVDERLSGPDVLIAPLTEFDANSFDVLTAIDVIEHVEAPQSFLHQLTRIARIGLFLTTPNWNVTHSTWPYHLREYTPKQLAVLLRPFGSLTFFKGTQRGDHIYRVTHRRGWSLLNRVRGFRPASLLARCVNRALPTSCKMYGHIGVWCDLNEG